MSAPDRPPVVTVDGPVSSGKGTVSQRVALQLGWHYLDSGALYRAVALLAGRAGVCADDGGRLAGLMADAEFTCQADDSNWARVTLNGEDISDAIRGETVSLAAAKLSAVPAVRLALRQVQAAQRRWPGLVADGRDMGTVLFPDAVAKFFLTADPLVRARRRHRQLIAKGHRATLADIVRDIEERDEQDRNRPLSPLAPAGDAVTIDSSGLGIDQVVAMVTAAVRSAMAAAAVAGSPVAGTATRNPMKNKNEPTSN